jgi:threonine dehydratase
MNDMPDFEQAAQRIERAMELIDPTFLATPQYASAALGAQLGCEVVLKVETANPVRCFKGRGADLLVGSLDGEPTRLSCASAGNFGQALAYAGRKRGVGVDVYAAANASPLKLQRMRQFGAQVHVTEEDFNGAKEIARADAERRGCRFVEDGREPEIADGAGTMALELTQLHGDFDAVLVPVGDGSLINGIGRWLKARTPGVEVIGVGPAGAPATERAWRTGDCSPSGPARTIADGLASRAPVPEAVAEMRHTADRFLLVDDHALVAATRLLFEAEGLVVEPSGAAGLAGALSLGEALRGKRIATPLCGSNLTREQTHAWLLADGSGT